jgi:benzoyl-CoA reductase subunit C
MTLMEKFSQASLLPNAWISDWKKQNKKVLGYICSYIPEEIISAAGLLPVRVRVQNCADTPFGDAYMTNTACSFTRCCLEAANRKELDYLDGIVTYNSCDQVRRLDDNLRFKAPLPYHYFLSIPTVLNEVTIEWFCNELSKFARNLETNFGCKITIDKLNYAIKVYNKTRALMKQLYGLRQRDTPPISGTETMQIMLGGVTIPREQFNEMLTQLIKEIETSQGISSYRARVMLVGSLLDNPEYIKIIEDLGGLVVTDSLCFGSRLFWDFVDEESDPLEALATRYLSKAACPRMADFEHSGLEFIKQMIKNFYVDGVIFQRMKFCPMWWGEIFQFRDQLKNLGVPCLDLEREYTLGGVGQMKTRIQAFLEVLEGK